jgi:hypothetical protein
MSLRSMRKQRGWRRQAGTRRERIGADLVSRARSKIITQSSIQDHHGAGDADMLSVAHRMSTGPDGDCEAPFFPDDLYVSATESRPISLFERSQRSTVEMSILGLGGRRIDREQAN